MPEEILNQEMTLIFEVVGPGGSPAGDLTVTGINGELAPPDAFSMAVGEVFNLAVGITNAHASQSYEIFDATLELLADSPVLVDVSVADIVGPGDGSVTLALTPANVRGTQRGTYKCKLHAREAA